MRSLVTKEEESSISLLGLVLAGVNTCFISPLVLILLLLCGGSWAGLKSVAELGIGG